MGLRLDDYRLIGRSGLRVSPLCLGTMTFGTEWGWGADETASRAIFETYAERGGNFLDTANFYTNGTSERLVGELIASDRDRFVLATKYTLCMRPGDPNAGGNHRKNMVRAVEASLERLGTDFIDLYWLHAWDYTTPVDEILRAFDDLVRAGKILYAGISDAPAWRIAEANTVADLRGWTRFVGLQVPYSLVRRDVERDLLPMARALGLGVTPWSPLASGVLSGKYGREDLGKSAAEGARPVDLTERSLDVVDVVRAVAAECGATPSQVAIGWLLTRPGVTSPILGARTKEQLEDNLGALAVTLNEGQRRRLDEASAIELGFPHDFLAKETVREIVYGGARIERRET